MLLLLVHVLYCDCLQVGGVDFRFQEKMRGVGEYMQYREMPAGIKRKVSALSDLSASHLCKCRNQLLELVEHPLAT
jgi:hypothetical protein